MTDSTRLRTECERCHKNAPFTMSGGGVNLRVCPTCYKILARKLIGGDDENQTPNGQNVHTSLP